MDFYSRGYAAQVTTTMRSDTELGRSALRGAPDTRADEFDGSEVILGALVVAGGDASEVLDAVEEALDEIALPIEPA